MDQVLTWFASVRDRYRYTTSRSPVKEAFAEFFGTFVLVLLGDGVMANCILGRLNLNSVLVEAFGWGFALMVGVAIAGGISGGHVNPAVTTGLICVKKCSLKRMVPYVVAQYIGSFLAAAVVYLIYLDSLVLYDGGYRQIPPSLNSTAEIFATYPQEFASTTTCFLDQVVASALLLIIICVATDSKNLRIPLHSQPIIIGLGTVAVILAFGHNCGAPLNPARDFSPRLFTAISGWGEGVFSYRNYTWFWIPFIAPHVGGIIGACLYKVLIEMTFDSRSMMLPETDSGFPDDESRFGVKVDLPYSPVNIQAEDEVYKHVVDKVVHDARIAADACLKATK